MYVEMNAQVRTKCGKGAARSVRRSDLVPGVIYGPRTAPMTISVPSKQLEKFLTDASKGASLITLNMDGGGEQATRHVMVKEVQVHPVRRKFLHVDFYEVTMNESIVMDIPVELMGEPAGIKFGGILNLLRRTLSVRSLPGQVPERISIDVSALNIGDTIHISDLIDKFPFELADDKTFAVVSLSGEIEKGKSTGGEASA